MSNLTYGSLFAGVGGFDLGFDSAGWECKFQVEWDKNCQEVLQRNWPDTLKYTDVRDVDGADLTPVDLISFGSPCQDLSVAGKRSGLDGDRSGLFFEGIRIIKEMRDATNGQYPKWAIWENVPGALTSNKGEDFGEVLNQMANIGALGIEWHILDAQWFGVAQRRRRIFVIACWDSSAIRRSNGKILSVPEDSNGDIKKRRKKGKSNPRAFETGIDGPIWYGKTGFSKYEEGGVSLSSSDHKRPDMNFILEPFVKTKRAQNNEDSESWISGNVSPTLNAFDNTGEARATVLVFQPGVMVRQGYGVSEDLVPTLRAEHHNGDNMPHIMVLDGTRVDDIRIYEDGIVPTLKHRMGTGGGQVPVLAYDGYNNKITEDTYRTIRTGIDSADHIAIPVDEKKFILRRLTPIECERLMGFPDNHTAFDRNGKKIADTNRYKMCGNAIASPVSHWIGVQLKNLIEREDIHG
jgi:DNA (cytosine-5)-methyltransferase 1